MSSLSFAKKKIRKIPGTLTLPTGDARIENIKRHLSDNIEESCRILESVLAAFKLQLEYEQQEVNYDVDIGSFIRALRITDPNEVEFIYNEGTTELVEVSDEGLVISGERTTSVKKNITGSVKVDLKHHFSAFSFYEGEFAPEKSDYVQMLDGIYNHLPKARQKYPDGLYHVNDRCGLGTRTEIFRSYLDATLLEFFSSIQDLANIAVFVYQSTREGAVRIEKLIAEANSSRSFPLSCSSDYHYHDDLNKYSYVYSMIDPYTMQSVMDGDYIAGHTNLTADQYFSDQLRNYDHLITRNSSFICLTYRPILTWAYHGSYMHLDSHPRCYDYSYIPTTPHKLWTITNITLRSDAYLIPGYINSRLTNDEYFKRSYFMIMSAYYFCVRRNQLLHNPQDDVSDWFADKTFYEYSKKCVHQLKYNAMMLHRPILLKSKFVKSDFNKISLNTSIDIAMCLARMEPDKQYDPNAMRIGGWCPENILRAVNQEVLFVGKTGSHYTYSKQRDQRYGTYYDDIIFGDVKTEIDKVSFLLPDGSIYGDDGFTEAFAFSSPSLLVRTRFSANTDSSIENQFAFDGKVYVSTSQVASPHVTNNNNVSGYSKPKKPPDIIHPKVNGDSLGVGRGTSTGSVKSDGGNFRIRDPPSDDGKSSVRDHTDPPDPDWGVV